MARDVFAQLVAPAPPRFPRTPLPLTAVPGGQPRGRDPFADERKLSTAADLERELVRTRKRHEPFLRRRNRRCRRSPC